MTTILHRWALLNKGGKTEKVCIAYTRRAAREWFKRWRMPREIPETWKVRDKGPANISIDVPSHRKDRLDEALREAEKTIYSARRERDEARKETMAATEELLHAKEDARIAKAQVAFGAGEIDRLRSEVEGMKKTIESTAHRERYEQRRAGKAEQKLRDLEALVRAERIKQRSGTTSLIGAADFILGVSDPSTTAVSTSSPT